MNHPPSYYEDLAIAAEKRGDWQYAIAAWNSASAASIGHNRSARYDARAEQLVKEYLPARAFVYLEDIERGKGHVVHNLMIVAEQIETECFLSDWTSRPFPEMSWADDVAYRIEEELAAGCYGDPQPYHWLGTPEQAEGG